MKNESRDVVSAQSRHPELDSGSIHRDDEGSPLTPTLSRRARGKRAAFTLAEVLITLAIIGVVAAMTIPTLIKNYQEKVTVTKVKKIYSNLTNAHKMVEAMNGYGAISGAYDETKTPAENTQAIVNLYKPYFKISKDCGFEPGCLTSGYLRSLSGVEHLDYDNVTNEYKLLLADGMALWFYVAPEIDTETGEERITMNIKVDVNGYAKPYQWGKDVFEFYITDNATIPSGGNNSYYPFDWYCKNNLVSREAGFGCSAWVVEHGNMDYLHCDDLSWDGKHKCSD